MTHFLSVWGEGSSGDSIVLSENQHPGESPLLPSPLSLLKPVVIPNSSTQKNKLFNRNLISGRMRDLPDPNKLLKVLYKLSYVIDC
jgi:hypothetical protein